MSVRFKFKNEKEFTPVICDGFNISVKDLKREIVRHRHLGRTTDFDLEVYNHGDNQPFDNDDALIQKNTSLVIVRRPLPAGSQKVWEELPVGSGHLGTAGSSGKKGDVLPFSKSAKDDLSEEDKLSAMMSNSSEMYDQKNWIKYRGRGMHKPGPHIKCHRCHQMGHFSPDCPLARSGFNGGELKKTTGIPRSFLKPASKDTPGAKINPQGKLVNSVSYSFRLICLWRYFIFISYLFSVYRNYVNSSFVSDMIQNIFLNKKYKPVNKIFPNHLLRF